MLEARMLNLDEGVFLRFVKYVDDHTYSDLCWDWIGSKRSARSVELDHARRAVAEMTPAQPVEPPF